ncbi:zinc ribbon domain-containing protein [Candidatus Magnetobacterium casense]|uniref:DZANK-type domain-containing protein n=1 Tax=Candidatus Magnetobacterium casense TaxID=1455061 RepID=A0ABS6RYS9_9BACT|nr:zinc ribbon domain-containing protein [Candidatus Magnetobacterium casensis]MBV6341766.1 hypothetical protein [Candidatus Magnetobacterium casensis]
MAEVKKRLSSLLKRKDDRQLDGLFSGKRLIIKNKVDYNTAVKYSNYFNQSGALCTIEAIDEPQESLVIEPVLKEKSADPPKHPLRRNDDTKTCTSCGETIQASDLICKLCNTPQKMSRECPNCKKLVPNHRDICVCGYNLSTGQSSGLKTCPACAEDVKQMAKKCHHCGYYFDKGFMNEEGVRQEKLKETKYALIYAIVGFFCYGMFLGPAAIFYANKALTTIKSSPQYADEKTKSTVAFWLGIVDTVGHAIILLATIGGR